MTGRPFTPEDFFRLRAPTFRVPMHLSPDGELLSLTVASRGRGKLERDQSFTPEGVPGEMAGGRVLVVDTATGEVRYPFGPDATSWAGMWSPDGRLLAAYLQEDGPPHPAVWDRESGEVRAYPDAHVRPFFGFEVPRWTPDSSALVLKLLASSKRVEQGRGAERDAPAAVRVYAFDPGAPEEALST